MGKKILIGVVMAILGVGAFAVITGKHSPSGSPGILGGLSFSGSSFTAKVKGGKVVTVDYSAIKDYVSMEADGEARDIGDMISIPVKCTVKKAFGSIIVGNKNAAKDNAIGIHGGKAGEKVANKLFLPKNEFMDEIELSVVTISE